MSQSVRDLHTAEIARLDEMIAALATPPDVDLAIHETRKGVKRLRAHLRLAKDDIEPSLYKGEDTDLRDIGRLLAPARDAFVLGETLDALESSAGWESASRYIAAHHRTTVDRLVAGPFGAARTRLEGVRTRWLDLPKRPDPVAVRNGIERTYRRGRAEFDTAAATGKAGAFHSWRRRVKYLRYQLEAIGGEEAVVMTWDQLGNTLGSEHDHSVFIDFCDNNIDMCPDRRDRYVLIDRAERRRDELRAAALGTDVYAVEPGDFVAAVLA